jgi:hypothetical protein
MGTHEQTVEEKPKEALLEKWHVRGPLSTFPSGQKNPGTRASHIRLGRMESPERIPQHRSVVVTGAAQGLGLAIARRFAASGSKVMLVDRDPKVRLQVGQEGLPQGGSWALVQDLRSNEAAQVVCANAREKLSSVDTFKRIHCRTANIRSKSQPPNNLWVQPAYGGVRATRLAD